MIVFVPWGVHMLCSDTGKTDVVHLPFLSVDEATDFHTAKRTVMENAEEGTITAIVKHGRIPIIETMWRKFRARRSVKQDL
jgi:hypothetical protein